MSTTSPTSGGTASSETLKREFSLWSAFGLAFAFISPIVALYAIFGFAFAAAGPSMWWAFLIVTIGQLFVAATFAELASKWPFEGAVYQWARRLRGESYGWWAGWAYIWTLVLAVATVCYGIAGFVPVVLGIDPFSSGVALLVAVGFVGVVSIINTVLPPARAALANAFTSVDLPEPPFRATAATTLIASFATDRLLVAGGGARDEQLAASL